MDSNIKRSRLSPQERHNSLIARITLNADGQISHVDRAAERMFGYNRDELSGQLFYRLLFLAERSAGNFEWELNTAYYRGESSNHQFFVRRDGARFWGSCVIKPIWQGDFQGYSIAVTRDRRIR